jgi:hypothetical protein
MGDLRPIDPVEEVEAITGHLRHASDHFVGHGVARRAHHPCQVNDAFQITVLDQMHQRLLRLLQLISLR